MKFCERCGNEISTKDGENMCEDCENGKRMNEKRKAARRAREAALRSCGLVKVRGALGGVHWE